MMMKAVLILALVSVLQVQMSSAFAPAAFGVVRQSSGTDALFAKGEGDDSGGAAIAKPAIKTEQKTKTVQKTKQTSKQKAKTHDPISRREEKFEDAPMFKLILIDDDEYDPAHVIERMCAIIDDMDEDQASTVVKQAGVSGKAMCGKYPFERAELFKEQLQRSDPMIFSDLEEENKKN